MNQCLEERETAVSEAVVKYRLCLKHFNMTQFEGLQQDSQTKSFKLCLSGLLLQSPTPISYAYPF